MFPVLDKTAITRRTAFFDGSANRGPVDHGIIGDALLELEQPTDCHSSRPSITALLSRP